VPHSQLATWLINQMAKISHVVYVPHGQLATWPINHVAKISNLKNNLEKFQFLIKKIEKENEYFSCVSYLPGGKLTK
jgi:molybdenum cofactor biosynthesis enzyme MoaA